MAFSFNNFKMLALKLNCSCAKSCFFKKALRPTGNQLIKLKKASRLNDEKHQTQVLLLLQLISDAHFTANQTDCYKT